MPNHNERPYHDLVEVDGGPDHNITHMQVQPHMFGIFLIGGMDKLDILRGYPGLSFLNPAEQVMSILNLGLANMALQINQYTLIWLDGLLKGVQSMAVVRCEIYAYDAELPKVIAYLQRKQAEANDSGEDSTDNVMCNGGDSNANDSGKDSSDDDMCNGGDTKANDSDEDSSDYKMGNGSDANTPVYASGNNNGQC